jgi:hypothetical protein
MVRYPWAGFEISVGRVRDIRGKGSRYPWEGFEISAAMVRDIRGKGSRYPREGFEISAGRVRLLTRREHHQLDLFPAGLQS